jgi:hypothetical protein
MIIAQVNSLYSTDSKHGFWWTLKDRRPPFVVFETLSVNGIITYHAIRIERFARFNETFHNKWTRRDHFVVLFFCSIVQIRLEKQLRACPVSMNAVQTSIIELASETSSGRMPVDRRLPRKFRLVFGLICVEFFNGVAVLVSSILLGTA